MSKIENFKNEQELVGRIEELRAEGVHDDDITVFSKDSLENTSLNYTDVNFKDAEGSAWDKFVAFFTSEEPEERAIEDLGLNDTEKQEYINDMQAGDILLHVSGSTPSASEAGTAAGTAGADARVAEDERDTFDADKQDEDYEGTMRAEDDVTGPDHERTAGSRASDEETLELHEERLNVDKENVQTGEVSVNKHVETERQEVDVPVEKEEVEIERRPVAGDKKDSASFDETAADGDESINIPVHEEKVNVSKDNVVDEEVVVKKNKVTDNEHVEEDVRREEVDINEDDSRRNTDRDRF